MILRRSHLKCAWDDLLSGEQIVGWVSAGTQCEIPDDPGVYRWTFRLEDSAKPRAYVGEAGNLHARIWDYLRAAKEPVTRAPDDAFTEMKLKAAIKAIRRSSIVRVGEYIARICDSQKAQLQRLRVGEDAIICGVEISKQLLSDKIGRVFLEHWAILSTEREGYVMLNRSRSTRGKALWKALHQD